MAYSEKVLDHYENPRNVGSFDKGDGTVGTGMVGAPACGDVMKLQIKVNEAGVIGQVTRVYPLTSEVTLLTDRDAAIPVLNERTQQRSAAFGGAEGGGALELRFVADGGELPRSGRGSVTVGTQGSTPLSGSVTVTTSTTTAPCFMRDTSSRLTSLGAAAPGISTAPITRSVSGRRSSMASWVE